MNRFGPAAALLLAALLTGCSAIPPAAIGAIAGAVGAAFRLDDDLLRLVEPDDNPSQPKGSKMSITLPTDGVGTLALQFVDQIGRPTTPPAGGTVSVDNTSVASAVLSAGGASVIVTPLAVGTANISYVNGALDASIGVTVVTPAAVAVTFGAASIAGQAAAAPAQ